MHIKKIQKPVKLLVYDFDGVLTDNKVVISENGIESVRVNRSDGLAINRLKKMGISQIILSTEVNVVVQKRAQKLDIPVLNGIENKKEVLINYLKEKNINKKHVVYFGNDLNDLDAMKYVGFSVAPADAYQEVKNIASIITTSKGGDGVIREFYSLLKLVRDK